jgi:diaminobutyrate acetyltransferase
MYLLWCRDFADTSVVAKVDGDIAGFVIGYRRPTEPATLFVWQVGVTEACRRQGLALAMLADLCDRLAPDLHFVEASVTPENYASARLFRSLATWLGAELGTAELFDALMFPPGCPHDREVLVRVGPFGSAWSTSDTSMDVERPVPA